MATTVYDGTGKAVSISEVKETDIPITVWGLPKVYITSNTAYSNLTKDTASNGTIKFIDGSTKLNLACTVKLQGEGSLLKAKKNLNIRLFVNDGKYKTKQKIKFGGWYATNKFHIKANEQEYTMSRNSVMTRVAKEWMGTDLPNGAMGYIDSFPVSLFYNNEWLGCYTWNLTQDGKLFNFSDSKETAGTNLAYRIYNGSQFTTPESWEYRGDEDETTEMRNVLSSMLANYTDTENITKAMVEEHFDTASLVNYLVIAEIFKAIDSLGNNYTISTWDGNKWYFSFYDLDSSVGVGFGGGSINPSGSIIQNPSGTSDFARFNQFMVKCVTLFADEIKDTYTRIRSRYDIPTFIYNRLFEFQSKWGLSNLTAENEKWESDKPAKNDIDTVVWFMTSRIASLDSIYEYSEE